MSGCLRTEIRNCRRILGICLILSAYSFVHALDRDRTLAQFHHTAWTAQDGAPSQITALAQTEDGYLWVGSARGLFRFDGIEFEPFVPPAGVSLPSQNVYALLAMPDGGLWISFRPFGLGFLKDGRMKIYSSLDESPNSEVFCLARDRDDRVWAGTLKGLAMFDGDRWIEIGNEWNLKDERVWSIFTDRDGTLWVAMGNTIMRLPPGSKSFEQTGIRADGIPNITRAPSGRLWITEWEKPIRTIATAEYGAVVDQTEIPIKAYKLHFDRDGTVWMVGSLIEGTKRMRFPELLENRVSSLKDVESFGASDGLTDITAGNILEDREGNIWVSSTRGLNRFSRRHFVSISLPSPYQRFTLLAGERGEVWVGSPADMPLLRVSAQKILPGAGSPMPVSSVYRGTDGTTWWGGQGGIWEQDEVGFRYFRYPKGPKEWFWEIFPNSQLGGLWGRLGDLGLVHLRDDTWADTERPNGLPERLPSASFVDTQGRIWLGYSTEIVCAMERGQASCLSRNEGVDIGKIKVIRGRENIWFGGEAGLGIFRAGRFRKVNAIHEPFASVSGIIEASSGDLWLNEIRGVIQIPAEEVRRLTGDPDHQVAYRLYSVPEGLPGGSQMNYTNSTAVEATDGRLWFATDNGLAWIDPSRIKNNPLPPPVLVKSLSTDERTYQPAEGIELPKGTENIRINYTALSLTVPERVSFKYRLEGLDPDWRPVGTRRDAFFTNLGPGSYRFRVIASNNDGVWNEEGAALEFRILPMFYQTSWFLALCAAAVLFMAWLGYKWRVRQVRNLLQFQFQERLAERTRIAQDLHDTLLQGIASASMQMEVIVDNLPAESHEKERLGRLHAMIGRLIEEGRNTVKGLRYERVGLDDLEAEVLRLRQELGGSKQTGFRVITEGRARPMNPVVGDDAVNIIHEALVNAIKHSGAANIETEIEYAANSLRILVRDDGIGIEPEILRMGREGHWGLKGMHERAENIGARLKILSRPGAGTEVELSVPGHIAFVDRHRRPFTRWLRGINGERPNGGRRNGPRP